jgi:hypothetical protein
MTDWNGPTARPSVGSTSRNSKKIGFSALQPLQASLTLFIFGWSVSQTVIFLDAPKLQRVGSNQNFADESRKLSVLDSP